MVTPRPEHRKWFVQHLRIALLPIAFAMLALSVRSALAWGPDGHRIVGAIAQAKLTPEAHAAVIELLVDEAEPSLAGVANWADEIRPQAARAYTRAWHYVNLPDLGCHLVASRDCADGDCVIAAIERQMQRLTAPDVPRQQRIEALKFVVHFVADIHQPLHTGLRSDRGGNDFRIRFHGEDWNLHSVWDSLILRARIAHDEDWSATAQRLGESAPALAAVGTPATWAMESCQLIRSAHIYPGKHRIHRIRGAHIYPGKYRIHRIHSAYLRRQRPIVEQRLQLAGLRLAALLNTVFSAPAASQDNG